MADSDAAANDDAGGYDFALYRYTPSLPAAVTAAVIFGILTIGHFWRMFWSRTWFCLPFAIGGVCELSPFALYQHLWYYHRWPRPLSKALFALVLQPNTPNL